jgi:hypothetical protein
MAGIQDFIGDLTIQPEHQPGQQHPSNPHDCWNYQEVHRHPVPQVTACISAP